MDPAHFIVAALVLLGCGSIVYLETNSKRNRKDGER
jgi:hypothetical protein